MQPINYILVTMQSLPKKNNRKSNPPKKQEKITLKTEKVTLQKNEKVTLKKQDLHTALVACGLNPMEQEVIDMTNEVARLVQKTQIISAPLTICGFNHFP